MNAEDVGVTSMKIYLPKVGGPNVDRRSNISLVIHESHFVSLLDSMSIPQLHISQAKGAQSLLSSSIWSPHKQIWP